MEMTRKELRTWLRLTHEFGPADRAQKMVLYAVFADMAEALQPVTVDFAHYGNVTRMSAKGVRRALRLLSLSGWVHLEQYHTSGASAIVTPSVPLTLEPVVYPGQPMARTGT